MRGPGASFRTLVAAVSLAAGLGLPFPVRAQDAICPDNQAIEACIKDLQLRAAANPAAAAGDRLALQAEDELEATPSGASGDGSSVGSATKDFTPLMSLAGLIFGEPVDDGQGNLAFDLNLRSCPKAEECQRSFKLELLVKVEPQISEVVKAALPEETRDKLAEKLSGAAGDDLTLAGSWSYTGGKRARRFGRDIAGYRGDLTSLVSSAVDQPLMTLKITTMNDLRNEFPENCAASIEAKRDRGVSIVDEAGLPVTDGDVNDLIDATRHGGTTKMGFARLNCKDALDAFENAHRDWSGLLDKLQFDAETKLAASGVDLFAELLDNQPQLFVTASARQVEDYFGSDEFAFGVTFETGMANLNSALRAADSSLANGAATTVLEGYRSYVAGHRSSIEAGQRFAFSATYARLDGGTVDLSALGLESVENVDAERLSISAAYSRYLYFQKDRPLRMDFKAQYDDISDDPSLQDRLVANLTFSVQAGEVEIPFGLVYANHSKYLGEVDEKVTAHIGLKFRGFGAKS